MSNLSAVLFDKDGTLFDFAATWEVWAAAFLRRLAPDDVQASQLGHAIGFDLKTLRFAPDSIVIAGTPGQVAHALLPNLPDWAYESILDLLNDEAENAPQAEAVPLHAFLQGLKASNLALGVVTNDAEKPALAHLDAAGVRSYFDFIAGFDSGYGAKPDPGPLTAFAQAIDVPASQVVMVGDSTHDLIAAKRAGMRAIGVLTGIAPAEALEPYAEAVFPDIGYLTSWIETQQTR